jgi:hypothetical protein
VSTAPSWGKIGLTTHVSGTLPTANGGTNLTSFTTNCIVYASSTSALATNSALTWNGSTLEVTGALSATGASSFATSSGSVGVGTASPALPFHVYNASAALAYFESTSASGPYVIWRSSGTSIGDIGSSLGISGLGAATDFMIASRSSPLLFGVGSAEKMRLDSSGNLGLGVASATYSGSGVLGINVAQTGNGILGNSSNIWISNNVSFNSGFKYARTSTASLYNQSGGSHVWSNAASGTAGNAITFTDAMTLDASGNLLVGNSTDPIAGNRLLVQSAATANNNRTMSVYNTAATSTTAFANRLMQLSSNASGADVSIQFTDQVANNAYFGMGSGALYFAIGSGTTKNMTLNSSGNLGIGTTSPVARLHLAGSGTSGQVTSSFIIENTSSGTMGVDITGSAGSSVARFRYGGGPSTGTNAMTGTFITAGLEGASAGTQGIYFAPTQVASADANTLDDYEEGAVTATLTCTSGTITLGYNTLRYTKIGRAVTLTGFISVASYSSPSGTLQLNGFPFAVANDPSYRPSISVKATGLAATAVTTIMGEGSEGSSYGVLYKFSAGSVSGLAGDVTTSTHFVINVTYFTT